MTTLSSRPTKRYTPVDIVSVLVFFALILTLLVIPFTGNIYTALGAGNSTNANSSSNVDYSFSADQQYWAAYCSHGWSSNSTCDDIVTRSQSCSISSESAYCSAYENYLKQLPN